MATRRAKAGGKPPKLKLTRADEELLARTAQGLFAQLGAMVGRRGARPFEPTALSALGSAFGLAMIEYRLGGSGPTGSLLAGAKKLGRWKPADGPPSPAALERQEVLAEAVVASLASRKIAVEEAPKIPPRLRPSALAPAIGAWLHREEAVLLPKRIDWGEKLYILAAARLIEISGRKVPPPVGLALLLRAFREALRAPPTPLA